MEQIHDTAACRQWAILGLVREYLNKTKKEEEARLDQITYAFLEHLRVDGGVGRTVQPIL
jgi:hypothetical protein